MTWSDVPATATKPPASGGWSDVPAAAPRVGAGGASGWSDVSATAPHRYGLPDLEALWVKAGGDAKDAPLMARVAYAESTGDPNAANQYDDKGKTYHVRGLWQVSDIHPTGSTADPLENARAAVALHRSQGLSPWEDSRNKGAGGGWGQYANVTPPGAHPAQAGVNPLAVAARGGALDSAVRGAKVAQHKASIDPMGWVDAIGGGLERLTFGTVAGGLGHGWTSMTHPGKNDEADTDAVLGILHIPVAKGNTLGARFERAAAREGVRVIGDPLNFIPFADIFGGVAKGTHLLEIASHAAGEIGGHVPGFDRTIKATRALAQSAYSRMSNAPMAQFMHEAFGRRPELDRFLGNSRIAAGQAATDMKGVRLGVEAKHISYEHIANAEAEAALAPVREALRNVKGGELPQAARDLYNQQVYRHGTPAMREEITAKFGYKPTADDLRLFPNPTGALNHNLVEDYQTLINPRGRWADQPIIKTTGGTHREEFRGFEKSRTADRELHETDQYARTLNRLKLGNARVRQVMVDRETEQLLTQRLGEARAAITKEKGLAPGSALTAEEEADATRRAGWRGTGDDAAVNVGKLSSGPRRAMPGSPLRAIGRVQKAAIKINPFPHGIKNVGTLAFLHGGPEAFGKGLGYAAKGLEDPQRARLVNMGVDADYVRDIEHPLGASALEELSPIERATSAATSMGRGYTAASNTVLTRIELGYRQAMLDQLDRKWPRMADPMQDVMLDYKKGEIIRQAIGDYRNTSYFISALDAMGGPFVAFRLGIVPGAVARAAMRRPNYVEAVAHTQRTINDSFQSGSPSELEMGGPVEDMGRAASNPFGYLESPASAGPTGLGMRYLDPNRTVGAGSVLEDVGRSLIPGFGLAEDTGLVNRALGGAGYKPPPGVSPAASGFASILGSYYRKRPSAAAERRYEKAERRAP